MIHSAISRLEELVNRLPATLSEKDASYFLSGSIAPGKWNRQEILGHLIDSALNNLQRFVRTQYEHDPFVYYEQDTWNKLNAYTQASHIELVDPSVQSLCNSTDAASRTGIRLCWSPRIPPEANHRILIFICLPDGILVILRREKNSETRTEYRRVQQAPNYIRYFYSS